MPGGLKLTPIGSWFILVPPLSLTSDGYEPVGLSILRYLNADWRAIVFKVSSLIPNPSLTGLPLPNPKSLNALLKSLAYDDDSPEIYLS